MAKWDFYTGFEGEPEIFIEHKNIVEPGSSIRTWEGYFDELMQALEPGVDGWRGVAAHFHQHTGWYEQKVWVDPDPEDTRDQLNAVASVDLDQPARELQSALIRLLEDALRVGGAVSIQYR